jgi:hypothetical protein
MGPLGVCLSGISSLAGLPMGVAAWVLGHKDLRRMRLGEMDPRGQSTTQAGLVCGIIGASLNLLCCTGHGAMLAIMFSGRM